MQAVDAAAVARNLKVEFYTMFCDVQNYIYKLYVEFPAGTTQNLKKSFRNWLMSILSVNPRFRKEESSRLNAPVLVDLKPNSYEMLKAKLLC